MTESPKWLLLKGRTLEAIEVYNYYCRFNGLGKEREIPHDAIFAEQYADLSKAQALKPDDDKMEGQKKKSRYGETMKGLTRQFSD